MATLNFEKYFIDSFSFAENHNFDTDSEALNVDFKPKAVVNILDKELKAVVVLSCTLGDETKSDCPFVGKVTVTGLFSVEIDPDNKDDENLGNAFLSQNTITILFPYLRSFIADMTLRSNKFPAFIIPTYNVIEMVKDTNSVTINHL